MLSKLILIFPLILFLLLLLVLILFPSFCVPSLFFDMSLCLSLYYISVSLLHHHQVPWLCVNAYYHVWYQWSSLWLVTVNPQGCCPVHCQEGPSMRQCVMCVNTKVGKLKRVWNGFLLLCCTFNFPIKLLPCISFDHRGEDGKYIQYILYVFPVTEIWDKFNLFLMSVFLALGLRMDSNNLQT